MNYIKSPFQIDNIFSYKYFRASSQPLDLSNCLFLSNDEKNVSIQVIVEFHVSIITTINKTLELLI